MVADSGFALGLSIPYRTLMPMPEPPQDLSRLSLAEIARLAAERRLPPVARWNPDHCGTSDMRIARDGTWHYRGSAIGRETLVRLFASILRREEDGTYVLVTPAEKLSIAVEDAPFVAVEMAADGQGRDVRLTFRTSVGDVVTADADHPLRFEAEAETGGLKPYLRVRGGLEALLARSVAHSLLERVEEEAGRASIRSCGSVFALPEVALG